MEQTTQVSKGARIDSQKNIPKGAKGVEQLSTRRKLDRVKQGDIIINKNLSMDGGKKRFGVLGTASLTPFDISQRVYQGESDSELVPMDTGEG